MIGKDNYPEEYRVWIETLKHKIQNVRTKVAISINTQLIELYWELGKEISRKLEHANWGTKVIEQIAIDLKHEFPEIKGFSRRNLYAIKQFFQFYSVEFEFVPQAVAQLPWGHNRLIISNNY